MKIFLDFSDERTKNLKNYLKKFKTFEINKNNLKLAENNDFFVYPPNKKWSEEELKTLPNNITLFCGKVDNCFHSVLTEKNIKHKNFLSDETFAIKNANLTAEGVLSIIISNTNKSLFELNILVLGYGRITKSLCLILSKLGAKFSIATFNKNSFSQSYLLSNNNYFEYDFLKDIKNFDCIINTRPEKYFDEQKTKQIPKNCLFIETASTKCLDETKAKHFNYYFAPALPKKYSSVSASKLLLEQILGEIK
ncbi:MAG: hypothetical protein IJ837_00985 [Clostridia bacterium]|nr:hypothetical protein [Clostridia bacterium]